MAHKIKLCSPMTLFVCLLVCLPFAAAESRTAKKGNDKPAAKLLPASAKSGKSGKPVETARKTDAKGKGKEAPPQTARNAGKSGDQLKGREPGKAIKADKNARAEVARKGSPAGDDKSAKQTDAKGKKNGRVETQTEVARKGAPARDDKSAKQTSAKGKKNDREEARDKAAELARGKKADQKRGAAKEDPRVNKTTVAARANAESQQAEQDRQRGEERATNLKAELKAETTRAAADDTTTRKGKYGAHKGAQADTEEEVKTIEVHTTAEVNRAKADQQSSARELAAQNTVPDRIEVIEFDPYTFGRENTAGRSLRALDSGNQSYSISTRRISVSIDPDRITEIQQALTAKGFYAGETTGAWDDATYEAMKKFQISQKIDATGYPTAHALKRLGLTNY
ncbi:MAG: peptidoglycan-binding protein [Blastocatellia bacterium]